MAVCCPWSCFPPGLSSSPCADEGSCLCHAVLRQHISPNLASLGVTRAGAVSLVPALPAVVQAHEGLSCGCEGTRGVGVLFLKQCNEGHKGGKGTGAVPSQQPKATIGQDRPCSPSPPGPPRWWGRASCASKSPTPAGSQCQHSLSWHGEILPVLCAGCSGLPPWDMGQ